MDVGCNGYTVKECVNVIPKRDEFELGILVDKVNEGMKQNAGSPEHRPTLKRAITTRDFNHTPTISSYFADGSGMEFPDPLYSL